MKYFVSWTYKGVLMNSDFYDFKYLIESEDDLNYLKTKIASKHQYNGNPCNPLLVNILNFVLLDEKGQEVTQSKYKYTVTYTCFKKVDAETEFCIFQNIFIMLTELRTSDDIKYLVQKIKDYEGEATSHIKLLSFQLLEIIEIEE